MQNSPECHVGEEDNVITVDFNLQARTARSKILWANTVQHRGRFDQFKESWFLYGISPSTQTTSAP